MAIAIEVFEGLRNLRISEIIYQKALKNVSEPNCMVSKYSYHLARTGE